ncbi:MAG: (d)CMP kinase [Anaerolineales bacterium]|nr:(d)CMP kinase [Anaerolineales bacterium]
MSKPLTIAIDGPVASGKSTLAKNLADALGYLYFDTGAMYRAVTLAALKRGVTLDDQPAVEALAHAVEIDLRPASVADQRLYDVLLDGEDCTWQLRQPDVEAHVSQVSAYAGVRSALTEQQRRIGLRGGVVMAGRDIGTVVLPEADPKIFLTASQEERARRRFEELQARGDSTPYADVLESLKQRDAYDTSRAVAPLRAAADAITLVSDGMQASEVLEEALALVRTRQAELANGT